MILKYISISELNFSESWEKGWKKLKALNTLDKYLTIFWLLGPIIYLIERDPADLWLSFICLIFLFRCYKLKDWRWASQLWFRSATTLWVFGLFSAITSENPYFTFQQGFVWIRFPLYAAAAQVWLAKDRDIRIVMLLSMLVGMIIMSGILIAETIIIPKDRLTWPYGDMVPGGYIAKVLLPLFCVLVAVASSKKNKAGLCSGTLALLSFGVSILTGERTNFLIKACSGFLASIIWKPKVILLSTLFLIEFLAVLTVLLTRSDLNRTFTKHFIKEIPLINTSDNNAYWGAWRSGLQQGIMKPLKGIGPSGTRNTCEALNTDLPRWLPGKNYCGNHPHNFYIQLFAETGIIGLFVGCIMFASIIFTCYKAKKENFNCPMSTTAFIVPFALFFPLQQFGSFYGQWGNLFTWFAIGFAISQYQGWRNPKNISEK